MNGLFATWLQRTCADTPSATSSPGSAAGPTPPALPDGPTNGLCGRAAPPASLFPLPGKAKHKRTSATSGPSSLSLSAPVGPLSSWENRLRQRLEKIGSTECVLTWKASVTPARRSLSRLVPLMRPIEEIASGLWPTPTARDHFPAHTPEYIAAKKAQGHGMSNLNDTVSLSMWPTPCASDDRDRGRWENPAIQRRVELGKQVMLSMLAQGSGTIIDGLSAQTEKRGALNPEFVCWLMGFPPEWDACAPTAMPSSRKSRQK